MAGTMEEQGTPRTSRIVVGVDGSAESVLALKWGQKMAQSLNTRIIAVTAWHMETVFGSYIIPDWDPDQDAQQLLKDAAQEAFGDGMPEGFTGVCVRGRPAKVLIDAAESAHMLIVGSRGRGGFKGMLLGSVSSACVEHAPCPVLVVPLSLDTVPGPETVGANNEDTDEPVSTS